MDAQTRMKHAVAAQAAALVTPGMTLGLGSGSTAALLAAELGARFAAGELPGLRVVPTSFQAEVLATDAGIPVATLNQVERIDLGIDGADEVDPHRALIKGGGGCHTQEKLVAVRADRFVVIVDATKLSDVLGSFPLPVEVLPQAYRQVARALAGLGGDPQLRMGVRKAGPVVTDQGNLILDATFPAITQPAELERTINNIPGVLENGLFVGLADQVLVGRQAGDTVIVESR